MLFVHEDVRVRNEMTSRLTELGFCVTATDDPADGLDLAGRMSFDVAVINARASQDSTLRLLQQLKSEAHCEVVLIVSEKNVRVAIEAMKRGAFDVLVDPVEVSAVVAAIENACTTNQLCGRSEYRCASVNRNEQPPEMIGDSDVMREVYRLIDRAGRSDRPILIQGESGVGKELAAKALHKASPLANKPLIVVNCAALPETLLESELFGHEKGSFTGAVSTKPGLFERADGGTLFIDEIGEMPGVLQAKLLRVLEDGSFRPIGSLEEKRVRVRLITATNRDLKQAVKQGLFREDLYYRIDVMGLELPPLRSRNGDIPQLARHFAGLGWTFSVDALASLAAYHWPGNVRQLINTIERAKILADGREIQLQHLTQEVQKCNPARSSTWTHVAREATSEFCLESAIRQQIEAALAKEHGNKVRAARALGVSRRSLYRLLEKHAIAVA